MSDFLLRHIGGLAWKSLYRGSLLHWVVYVVMPLVSPAL